MDYLQRAKEAYEEGRQFGGQADGQWAQMAFAEARAVAAIAAATDQREAYAKAEATLTDLIAKAEGC